MHCSMVGHLRNGRGCQWGAWGLEVTQLELWSRWGCPAVGHEGADAAQRLTHAEGSGGSGLGLGLGRLLCEGESTTPPGLPKLFWRDRSRASRSWACSCPCHVRVRARGVGVRLPAGRPLRPGAAPAPHSSRTAPNRAAPPLHEGGSRLQARHHAEHVRGHGARRHACR